MLKSDLAVIRECPTAAVEHAQAACLHQRAGAHLCQRFGARRKAMLPAQVGIELQALDSAGLIERALGGEEGVVHQLPAEDAHPGLPDLVPARHIAGVLRRAVAFALGQLLAAAEEVIDCPALVIPLGGGQHGAGFFEQVLVVEDGDGRDIVGHAIDAALVRIGFDRQVGEVGQVIIVGVYIGLEVEQQVIGQELGQQADFDDEDIGRDASRQTGEELVVVALVRAARHGGEVERAARIGVVKGRKGFFADADERWTIPKHDGDFLVVLRHHRAESRDNGCAGRQRADPADAQEVAAAHVNLVCHFCCLLTNHGS